MPKSRSILITMPPSDHEKAKEISKRIFGKVNVSGLYSYWINSYYNDVIKPEKK